MHDSPVTRQLKLQSFCWPQKTPVRCKWSVSQILSKRWWGLHFKFLSRVRGKSAAHFSPETFQGNLRCMFGFGQGKVLPASWFFLSRSTSGQDCGGVGQAILAAACNVKRGGTPPRCTWGVTCKPATLAETTKIARNYGTEVTFKSLVRVQEPKLTPR